jgi:alanyl-tRNA synthetase
MKKLTTNELRKLYLDFFVQRAHRLVKSDSLVPVNDPSVLFTSAGMNQFKDYFLGKKKDFTRAVSCQKCFRTGDLDEVGATPFHHTFFEMLGNFSFGDYFKKEAIAWGWEFVTEVLDIDPEDLWVSVYQDDKEAYDLWKHGIGLPAEKIKMFGAKDNFWPSNAITDGPNGPCGPCSEIYFQKEDGQSVEVWNLVFTQFNRCDGGVLEPLPKKNIDTGMGLERISQVLQGVDSNYKIDIFAPIVEAVKNASGVCGQKALYMLSDHVRAVTFCIGDGVLPSNDGRGYVVRKLIRRCQYMASSAKPEPFLFKAVASVAAVMQEAYPEVLERRDNIAQIIRAEEEKYIRNILEGGSEKLKGIIESLEASGQKTLSPAAGMDLFVTYGVPLDYTSDVCRKQGIAFDIKESEALLTKEQERSRASSKIAGSIFAGGGVSLKPSRFVGYEDELCLTKVVQIIKDAREVEEALVSDQVGIVLEKTPFFAESGGQVGDTGFLFPKDSNVKIKIHDTLKQDGVSLHLGFIESMTGSEGVIKSGDLVTAQVDHERRQALRRAHTATHILQAVLRRVLGEHVQQAGSFVEPDRFRFDFTHFKEISVEEAADIQLLLNEYVIKNDEVSAREMTKAEAQKTGAIALFGEKYEDTVRVISVGDYSKEFCGGTHLNQTGHIGIILITGGSSVGSGLRRIEALTGKLAYEKVFENFTFLHEACDRLKTVPENLSLNLEQHLLRLKALENDNLCLKEMSLKEDEKKRIASGMMIGDILFVVAKYENFDVALLRKSIDRMKEQRLHEGVFFLASMKDKDVAFMCGVTEDLVKRGFSANDIMKKALIPAGGSGGGRKDFAQGGTKDVSKVGLVLKEAERLLREKAV